MNHFYYIFAQSFNNSVSLFVGILFIIFFIVFIVSWISVPFVLFSIKKRLNIIEGVIEDIKEKINKRNEL